MSNDKLFFIYMALVGTASGAILVARPAAGDFWIKPYFWILLAVLFFEALAFMRMKSTPGVPLSMEARLLGFVIGIVLMVVIPSIAGSPAKFF